MSSVRLANLIVFCVENDGGEPGQAIGATWLCQVVINLPREQFADLLALALSDKLQTSIC